MINNKKIVLTGCNSGIGLEVLKILLKGENKILCVDKDIDVLKSLNSEKIIILQKDVSSKEAVDEVLSCGRKPWHYRYFLCQRGLRLL